MIVRYPKYKRIPNPIIEYLCSYQTSRAELFWFHQRQRRMLSNIYCLHSPCHFSLPIAILTESHSDSNETLYNHSKGRGRHIFWHHLGIKGKGAEKFASGDYQEWVFDKDDGMSLI